MSQKRNQSRLTRKNEVDTPFGAVAMRNLALAAADLRAYPQATGSTRAFSGVDYEGRTMMHLNRILAPVGISVLLAACGANPAVTLADKSLMPEVVMMQSVHVQEAYRFAAAHPEDLKTIPCYCGCSKLNHRNNLDCYLKPESRPDALVFDNHALGCEICADITHLTMDLVDAGASPGAIRTAVDAQFAARGPGTDTPHPTSEHASAGM